MTKEGDGHRRLLLLLEDRDRLDEMRWAMYAAVQKELFPYQAGRTRGDPGWVTAGGISMEDIVQEAFAELCVADLTEITSPEALGVDIARKRAIDALRRAGVDKFEVSSLDSWSEVGDGSPWWDRLVYDELDAEQQYELLRQQRRVWELVQSHLNERERRLFYEMHFLGKSGAEVGRSLVPPVSGQWVRRVYARLARRVLRSL